ncbi:MAG: hypothetical protein H0T76_28520 [Nannocystis sp.]|nr:hypothetical protein [Nannocystis sp.]MBA3550439.1 hypothetical protein [Nannocystis sp.]
MQRNHRPLHPLFSSLLIAACHSGDDAESGLVDLATASTSPSSTSTDPPPTSPPTTSATSATSTGTPTDATSTGSTSSGSTGGASTADNEPSTSSSSTTEPAPSESCGDAIFDPNEECDLGAAQNRDQGACTLECKLPKCGDKLIWAGKESCDNGTENNDSSYGGCTTQCQYGPRCGDGKLQGPEECDLGPDNGSGEFLPNSVPCTNGCRYDAKLVFLSSVTYMGGKLNGADGAHKKCQGLAADAGIDNALNFKAWISDAVFTPAHIDKGFTKTVGTPYVRPDGVRIADDWNELILNGPDIGILVTEKGVAVPNKGVWTGTAPNGELAPDTLTCQGWNSPEAADKGHAGFSGVNMPWVDVEHWTSFSVFNCITEFPIFCFEQ